MEFITPHAMIQVSQTTLLNNLIYFDNPKTPKLPMHPNLYNRYKRLKLTIVWVTQLVRIGKPNNGPRG